MRMKFSVHTVSRALLRGGNVESREVSPMQVIDPTQRQSPVTNKDGSDLKAYELRRGSAAYRFARKNEPHLILRHTPGRKNSYGNVTDDLKLRWPPSSRRPWVSRHHALAFAVLAAKNPSHLVSPQKASGFRDHRPPARDRCLCLWTPYLGTAFQA